MNTRTPDPDIALAECILTGLRQTSAGLSAAADNALRALPRGTTGRSGVRARAGAMETAFAGLEEHDSWAVYYWLLLAVHTDPDFRIDDAQLGRVMPGVALAFRARLAERMKPIDDALVQRECRDAAWLLVTTVSTHQISLAPGEEAVLDRIRGHLYETTGPRD